MFRDHSPIVIYLFFRYKELILIVMTIERQKLFLRMITPLFQAQQSVADLFFKNQLNEDIEYVLDKHIQYLANSSEESQREYIRVLKNLNRVVQEIIYLEKGDAVLFAVAHEQLLRYLADFLKGVRISRQTPIKTEVAPKIIEPTPRSAIPNEPAVQKPVRSKGPSLRAGKLTKTQESILEFVRQEPDCRTKDVISQFSALSQRTIKRGLKELSEEGRIIKKSDGVAVYYSVA